MTPILTCGSRGDDVRLEKSHFRSRLHGGLGGVCVFELFYILHLKAPPLWDWAGGES